VALAASLLLAAQDSPWDREGDKAIDFAFSELAKLDLFVGPWSVTENHFDPRGQIMATVKGTEEITWVLDYRAIRRIYSTSTGEKVFRAHGLITWNEAEKKYHGAWFDNASAAGPTIVKGTWDDQTRTMLFELESSGPNGPVRHRVVEKFLDAEKRVASTYLVEGSTLTKRLEVEYFRAKPCPGRIRSFFGG
jgi:hypothetical protein